MLSEKFKWKDRVVRYCHVRSSSRWQCRSGNWRVDVPEGGRRGQNGACSLGECWIPVSWDVSDDDDVRGVGLEREGLFIALLQSSAYALCEDGRPERT